MTAPVITVPAFGSAHDGVRHFFGTRLDKEVERIDYAHVGEEVDLDAKFVRLFRENVTSNPVALRVLLPVHKMLGRRDLQRII